MLIVALRVTGCISGEPTQAAYIALTCARGHPPQSSGPSRSEEHPGCEAHHALTLTLWSHWTSEVNGKRTVKAPVTGCADVARLTPVTATQELVLVSKA